MKKLTMMYIGIIGIIGTLTMWGCDKLLTYEPKQAISSSAVLSSSDKVELVLVGGYNALSEEGAYGGLAMLLPDFLANSGDLKFVGTYEDLAIIINKQQTPTNRWVKQVWIDFYRVINIANNVLGALDVVDRDIRGRVEGEAKFLRGVAYFELVRLFAEPWNEGDPSQNLGVPLVLKPETLYRENAKLPRATVAEVYAQVRSDLQDAKKLLPEKNGMYATTFAAAAMLSRVYLQQQRYQKAAEEANYVIKNGSFSLPEDYEDVFNRTGSVATGTIFALRVSSQDGENALNTYYATRSFGGRGDILLTPRHLSLYEIGSERLDINYSDAVGVRTGKYKAQFGNIPVIRLAEMYLTRAECNFRLGSGNYVGPNTPAEDLNIIRNRVELSDIANPTLQDILEERFLELAFEGFWLHDFKRLEQSFGKFSWDDPIMVFPIPFREIHANPNLVQNEGY